MEYYAHTREGLSPEFWEPLDVHLRAVAARAESFAAAFRSGAWGRLAGLGHDLGKFLAEFQQRLHGASIQVEHAGAGAVAARELGESALPLAFAIAGHHAGLANLHAQGISDLTPLLTRLSLQQLAWGLVQKVLPFGLWPDTAPPLPEFLQFAATRDRNEIDRQRRAFDLWTRFLFSALVDADYLATEKFCDPGAAERRTPYDSIDELLARLDACLAGFSADSPVNAARADILAACRTAAELPPGLFSLTVPTGGGKTLSGLAFALDHAIRHGLRRVIVAIPYTSIIEQTAAVYRDVLGAGNVVEHHSSIDVQSRREADAELEGRRRLAAENWDAPVIVTTNVQLLESLLANRTSRCRKLHNVARSIILLDEAQCLPASLLASVLDVLNELVAHYGCTVALSTATQPALRRREDFAGLTNVREIIPDPPALADRLRRVTIRWPATPNPPSSYEPLAVELAQYERVLAIVHRRQDARDLAKLLPAKGRVHLSALMCPAHRLDVLADVKRHLKAGPEAGPLRLVATQLVEAGVDIDFPVVYRALAGLDSLAQAAGRCDREGRLTAAAGRPAGEVCFFVAPTEPPPGILRKGFETTLSLLSQHDATLDLADPELFETYFRMLYGKCELDPLGIQGERAQLNFATVAKQFQLIEDDYQTPVVVPYGDALERLRHFEHTHDRRDALRALQPFLVQIGLREFQWLEAAGGIEQIQEMVNVISQPFRHLYHECFGLVIEEELTMAPESLIS